jgi:hypothetical protein
MIPKEYLESAVSVEDVRVGSFMKLKLWMKL